MAKKSSKDVWRNFGFNLGFGARPWIRAFGEAWQHKLAEAIVSGKQTVSYDGYSFSDAYGTYYHPSGFIKVPNAAESFKKEAKAYLAKARKLAKLEQRYDPTLTYDESYIRRISSEQEIFNLKIIHGRRKLLDAKSQKIVANIREQIANEFDVRERRKIYERAKKVEESLKRPAWQVIAENRGDAPTIFDEYPPVVGPTTQLRDEHPYQTTDWEGDLFDLIDDLSSSSDNFMDESEDQMADNAMDDIEAFLEDRYAGIPKEKKKHGPSLPDFDMLDELDYDRRIERLVEYLEKTKNIREDVYNALVAHPRLQEAIERIIGGSRFREILRRATRKRGITPTYDIKRRTYAYRKIDKPIKSISQRRKDYGK